MALQKGPQAARPGLLELNPEAQTEGRKAQTKREPKVPGGWERRGDSESEGK